MVAFALCITAATPPVAFHWKTAAGLDRKCCWPGRATSAGKRDRCDLPVAETLRKLLLSLQTDGRKEYQRWWVERVRVHTVQVHHQDLEGSKLYTRDRGSFWVLSMVIQPLCDVDMAL